ncbi:heme o synthase [Sorangium sp. So ce1014]|uniref:heme o synthase n=1 Tax=Sorangium sp. So ce1014 TaxID=3133326 RepID=UPI003F5F3DCE
MSVEPAAERAPVPYIRQAEPSEGDDCALPTGARPLLKVAADLVSLTKPRITRMVAATMLGGMWVASRYLGVGLGGQAVDRAAVPATQLALALLGTVLVVSGANVLNMYIERDTDRLMERTRSRPLPARRLAPEVALWFGIALSVTSLLLLFVGVNAVTGALAALALLSYVLVYTPLKRRTTLSLPIGAIPGAIPPLLGWTSVTGQIDAPGFMLFAVMFLWQIPHFLAIALFRQDEYRRAGLKVLPLEKGDRTTRLHIVGYLALLVLASVLLFPLGAAGPVYLGAAVLLGAAFFGLGVSGLRPGTGAPWARRVFFASMVYLVLLFAALMIGA